MRTQTKVPKQFNDQSSALEGSTFLRGLVLLSLKSSDRVVFRCGEDVTDCLDAIVLRFEGDSCNVELVPDRSSFASLLRLDGERVVTLRGEKIAFRLVGDGVGVSGVSGDEFGVAAMREGPASGV